MLETISLSSRANAIGAFRAKAAAEEQFSVAAVTGHPELPGDKWVQ